MLSCGSDNKLIVWKDVTEEADRQAFEQLQLEAAQALEIESLSREGKTIEALSLSLRLNRPHQTRMLLKGSFEKLLFTHIEEETGRDVKNHSIEERKVDESLAITELELSDWINNLSEDDLKRLMEFVVKWNANGQTASLANALMAVVIKTIP